jgi:hypothetical protein
LDNKNGDNLQEQGEDGDASPVQSLPSIIEHFKELELNAQSTVFEANRRRTSTYYEKAREAHQQSLVLGIPNYSKLLKKRRKELERLQFYYKEGKKSLRTVVVMCDPETSQILAEARQRILAPLNYSWDMYSRGVWIPQMNVIPKHDMHVTIAVPWWWHTMEEDNAELSYALAQRLRQTLVKDFHHPFCIELERIVFLGGKTLLALWRTVGERYVRDRETQQEFSLVDRHSMDIDPMVRLRREIVECFTTEQEDYRTKPLTHQHRKQRKRAESSADLDSKSTKLLPDQFCPLTRANSLPKENTPPSIPKPTSLKQADRQHSIELRTPGMASGDGFIHTTLCRLPLDCLSSEDVELEPIHRLCREATATYAGHRMYVHKFRFVETTGEGGDSNPCVGPIFDETMVAPTKIVVDATGNIHRTSNFLQSTISRDNMAAMTIEERNALTTGAVKAFTSGGGLDGLFDPQRKF